MRIELLGVRGSTAAPGPDFVRYGGHTSCVAVSGEGSDVPSLVLDAGTGLRVLSARLQGKAYDGSILLTHLHWDHMQGLPFFVAGDRDDSRVDVYIPAQEGRSGRDLLAQSFSPPAFPISPEGLLGRWAFHALNDGDHTIEGFAVSAVDVEHKGGRTFGYRITDQHASMAYLPDHAPAAGRSAALLEILSGVDVLLHDAQFLEAERRLARAYGHATVEDAVALALECGVRMLVLFHHSPVRSDAALDEIASWARAHTCDLQVFVAVEGTVLEIGSDGGPSVR